MKAEKKANKSGKVVDIIVIVAAVCIIALIVTIGCKLIFGVKGELQYELNEDGNSYSVVLSDPVNITRTMYIINIPRSYNGKPVTRIGSYAFKGCSGLTRITIPNNTGKYTIHCTYGDIKKENIENESGR